MSALSLGKRGPAPLPRAVKLARGTLRKCREPFAEPILAAIRLPGPPDDLTPLERATWIELCVGLKPMRVATRADLAAFRLMVIAVARAEEVAHVKNVYAFASAQKLALTHLAQWGLTPASRRRVSQIGEAEPEPTDPLHEFEAPGGHA